MQQDTVSDQILEGDTAEGNNLNETFVAAFKTAESGNPFSPSMIYDNLLDTWIATKLEESNVQKEHTGFYKLC
jgi:hypothetical protein